MSETFRTISGLPIFYRTSDGTVHRCEGADVHPGVRLIWTLCKIDVPAGAAWIAPGGDPHVSCFRCRKGASHG